MWDMGPKWSKSNRETGRFSIPVLGSLGSLERLRWKMNGETTPDLFWPLEVVHGAGWGPYNKSSQMIPRCSLYKQIAPSSCVSQFLKSVQQVVHVFFCQIHTWYGSRFFDVHQWLSFTKIHRKPSFFMFFFPQIWVFQGVPAKFPSTNSVIPIFSLVIAGCIFDRHPAAGQTDQTRLSCDMSQADPHRELWFELQPRGDTMGLPLPIEHVQDFRWTKSTTNLS